MKIIPGVITSHTKYFKDVRNARLERYAYETNKLLIRLDKLLNNLPSDPVDRKGERVYSYLSTDIMFTYITDA